MPCSVPGCCRLARREGSALAAARPPHVACDILKGPQVRCGQPGGGRVCPEIVLAQLLIIAGPSSLH